MEVQQQWLALAPIDEIPDGLSVWTKRRQQVVVVKEANTITSVFANKCPHNKRIKLSVDYELDKESITCKFHGACYKLRDGNQTGGPGEESLELFQFRIDDNQLFVLL